MIPEMGIYNLKGGGGYDMTSRRVEKILSDNKLKTIE